MDEIKKDVKFTVVTCPKCFMHTAMTKKFIAERKEDYKTIWCPAGHSMCYPDKSKTEILQEEIDKMNSQKKSCYAKIENLETKLEETKKSRTSFKAHFHRLKNKAEKKNA